MRTRRILPCMFVAALLVLVITPRAVIAQSSVTIPGSLQDELGCPADWQPDCAATHLGFDADDDVWQGTFTIPAGSYEYKAAIDDSWAENYGAGGVPDGANIPLDLGAATDVKFYYDHKTHWITDNVNSVIAVAVGSFQSALGCPGDWDPACLRSWLQDADGDGLFTFSTDAIPAGDYEAKVTIDESWDENYGLGGVAGGANIPFTVPADGTLMLFLFDDASKIMTIAPVVFSEPASVTIAGSLQDELGCPGDWQPDCASTHLSFDPDDGVWQGVFSLPAGDWEYKAALNDSWAENYGANAARDGANIPLSLSDPTDVKFYYDHKTHWITDNVNSVIAVVAGDFQSELGCAGDWQPWCLQSWLQDPDGDGIYSFSTSSLPPGHYECKVAHDEDWAENYGLNGEPNGPNISFIVPAENTEMTFSYDPETHILTISGGNRPPDCAAALPSLTALWPPNHKLVPIEILGVTDPDGDEVTITVTGVMQDEPLKAKGSGNTCPDAIIEDGAVSVRAERSGKGDGRVYVIAFTAEDELGATCAGEVMVCVPHDQGDLDPTAGFASRSRFRPVGMCVGEDATYNSLGPCPGNGPQVFSDGNGAEGPQLRLTRSSGNTATIEYSLWVDSDVLLAVYDVSGRRIATIEKGQRTAGIHTASWDTGGLSPGLYFYRLRAGDRVVSTTVLIMR